MKIEKRFVTRPYLWPNGRGRTWNIWDKIECKWVTELGFVAREYALKWADEMNMEVRLKRNPYEILS